MTTKSPQTGPQIELSVVAPLYNESAGITKFHTALLDSLKAAKLSNYEIIYCDDGSRDNTAALVREWSKNNPNIKLLALSRNFGKEVATSAGIHAAQGQAIVTIDADGQHPVELIPEFLTRWRSGSKVIIGIRKSNTKEGFVKRVGSKLFYGLFNRFTGMKLLQNSSDFRLIDHSVQQEFVRLNEKNRITRGLIDWLGFKRDYIEFNANPRLHGEAGYSFRRLFKLAVDSAISLSISPLYITAYFGAVVLPLSLILGLLIIINWIISDPFHLNITGGAYVMVLMLFLIGVLLVSQGIIGLYLSHIHAETQNRPLYIIDKSRSEGIHDDA